MPHPSVSTLLCTTYLGCTVLFVTTTPPARHALDLLQYAIDTSASASSSQRHLIRCPSTRDTSFVAGHHSSKYRYDVRSRRWGSHTSSYRSQSRQGFPHSHPRRLGSLSALGALQGVRIEFPLDRWVMKIWHGQIYLSSCQLLVICTRRRHLVMMFSSSADTAHQLKPLESVTLSSSAARTPRSSYDS